MALFYPLPSEPTAEMRAAFEVLSSEGAYPIPAGQAALWAVLSGYSDDPAAWVDQLMSLTHALLEEET